MPVIALTQEMGSLAKDVADQLTRELGLSTVRHEMAESVANKMHVSKSLIHRLREGKAGIIERMSADSDSLAVYTAEEVLETAARGNVVLRGWGATCHLRPVPHVVCVRITRSLPKRVEWLMQQFETIDANFAEAEIARSDRAHAARMHEQFGVAWGDPLLYDLVINTDRLSVDSCVGQIRTLVGRPEFAETAHSHAILQNMALEARIRSALRANDTTREVDITIESSGAGHVTLSGMALPGGERVAVENMAAAVPGVASVNNQLREMVMSRLFTSAKI